MAEDFLLFQAAREGDLDGVKDAIEVQKVDIDSRDEKVKYLIKQRSNPDIGDNRNTTAVMIASRDNPEILKFLLKNACYSSNDFGYTPLMWALISHSVEGVELLLEDQADTNTRDLTGTTGILNTYLPNSLLALMVAARDNCIEILELLLDNPNTQIDLADYNGWTALMWAVKNNSIEAVNILLKHKAAISIKNKNRETVMDVAVNDDIISLLKISLEEKAIERLDEIEQKVDEQRKVEEKKKRIEKAKRTESELKRNEEILESKNLLLIAAAKGNISHVKDAIEVKNIDINSVTSSGKTALMIGVIFRHPEIVRSLILNKADVSIRDKWLRGKTVYDYADQEMKTIIDDALKERELATKKKKLMLKAAKKVQDDIRVSIVFESSLTLLQQHEEIQKKLEIQKKEIEKKQAIELKKNEELVNKSVKVATTKAEIANKTVLKVLKRLRSNSLDIRSSPPGSPHGSRSGTPSNKGWGYIMAKGLEEERIRQEETRNTPPATPKEKSISESIQTNNSEIIDVAAQKENPVSDSTEKSHKEENRDAITFQASVEKNCNEVDH